MAVAKVSARRGGHAHCESGVGEGSVCPDHQAGSLGTVDRYAAEPARRQSAPRPPVRRRRGTRWTQPLSEGRRRRRRRSPVSCPLTLRTPAGPRAPPSLPCSPPLTCLCGDHLHKASPEASTPPQPPGRSPLSIKWRLAGGGNSNQPIIRRLLGTLEPMTLKFLE